MQPIKMITIRNACRGLLSTKAASNGHMMVRSQFAMPLESTAMRHVEVNSYTRDAIQINACRDDHSATCNKLGSSIDK